MLHYLRPKAYSNIQFSNRYVFKKISSQVIIFCQIKLIRCYYFHATKKASIIMCRVITMHADLPYAGFAIPGLFL